MRCARLLGLTTALLVFLLPGVDAQQNPMFARPFQYSDPNGPEVLTITPLTTESTRLTFQPIQVTLVQSSRQFVGSGVYHSFTDEQADLPPFALVAFTLSGPTGQCTFFQGRIVPVNGYTGDGTYFPVGSPQAAVPWQVSSTLTPPGPVPVINSTPLLYQGWYRISFGEAVGGVYYSTYNTFQTPVSTATWSGAVSTPGSFNVEVFIPRQPGVSYLPRTSRATYRIFHAGAGGQSLRTLSQQVTTSQWVPLGTYFFNSSYQIVLTDATGEAQQSRSVVANAIRLTPVAAVTTSR
jgi:hypothetical protein